MEVTKARPTWLAVVVVAVHTVVVAATSMVVVAVPLTTRVTVAAPSAPTTTRVMRGRVLAVARTLVPFARCAL